MSDPKKSGSKRDLTSRDCCVRARLKRKNLVTRNFSGERQIIQIADGVYVVSSRSNRAGWTE